MSTRTSSRLKKADEPKEDDALNNEEDAEMDENAEENDEDAAAEENGDHDGEENGDGEGEEGEGAGGDGEAKVSDETRKEAKEANKEIANLDTDTMPIDDILKLQIKLIDGSENFLFSRGPKYAEDKWPVNCHLCRLGNLFSDEHIRHHLKGRGHKNKLKYRVPFAKYYNEPFLTSVPKEFEKEKPIKIYPGEFIEELTEEYEDRILKPEEFAVKPPSDEKTIKTLNKERMHDYNAKLPLMGLCYIYKMMGHRGLTYYCTLCDTKLNEQQAFKHIVGSDHQFKYIKRHFTKLSEKVNKKLKELRDVDVRFSERNIFRKFYRKIENIKGQKKLTICDDDDFFKNKKRYLLKTRFDEHYDENTIIISDQEVDVLVRKCKNNMQFIKPDLISIDNPQLGYRMTFRDEKAGRQVSDQDNNNDRKRGRGRDDDGYDGGRGAADSGGAWNHYFQVIEREVEDLNFEYRTYERSPRNHPKYQTEHLRYNNGRKRGGGGRDKKEFNMPWNSYWKRRLRVLYESEVEKRKQRLKRQLGLRLTARTPSPPRRGGDYNNDAIQGNYGGGFGNDQAIAGLRDLMTIMQQQQSVSSFNSGGGGGGGNYNRPLTPEPPPLRQTEPLGVISVLRLFNALENQLGSLGPQAVQLLSRAVIVEKNGANPNDLMMEKDFYIFFATAREKLKGQYIANTIPTNLMNAAKKIIQDSSTLMEMFEDYCKRTGKNLPDMNMDSGIINKSMGNMGNMGGNNNGSLGMWKSDLGNSQVGNGGNRFSNDDFFMGGNNGNSNDNRGFGGGGGGMGMGNNTSYGYSTGGGYSTGSVGGGGGGFSSGRW